MSLYGRSSRALTLSGASALLLLLCLPVTGSAAQPQPKPSLAGESFAGTPTVTFTCDPMNSSTISYTVTGTATGPYLGTFTETGTAALGPQGIWKDPLNPNAPGDVTSFSATFMIQTSNGVKVSGSKQLAPPGTLAGNLGFCDNFGLQSFGAQADYTASIKAKGPSCTDTGQSGTAVNQRFGDPNPTFVENFDTNHPLC